MDTRFFRWMVLTSMCFAMSTAQAAEEAKGADKADEQLTKEAPAVSAEVALQQQIELGRQRALQMRGPRDAQLAEIGQVNEQVEARKQAILAENEAAAELKVEIAELEQALVEKTEALVAIFDGDEALQALRTKQDEAREALRKSQLKLRHEIARQHRERRQQLEQARQDVAQAVTKKDEADASETEEQGEGTKD